MRRWVFFSPKNKEFYILRGAPKCYNTLMYLKSLTIHGFKSFAGSYDMTFDSPITSIVGPNGSGKSNVAEAFRFALGEQSTKSLRGKKSSDLIFNGGAGGQKVNRASVKVTFDNSDHYLDVAFDEVVLERVVNRDNSNEYFINGSPARLKDITEMLSKAHIGPSGHHIISQGEADRLLNANQKERRAILEDALGLRHFQTQKKETLKKFVKTENNMDEVVLLRREIAPQLRYLKKQVEKAEEAKNLRQELQDLYITYLAYEDIYLEIRHRDLTKSFIGPDQEKKEILEVLKKLESEFTSLKSVYSQDSQKNHSEEEINSLKKEIQKTSEIMTQNISALGEKKADLRSLEILQEKSKRTPEDPHFPLSQVDILVSPFLSTLETLLEERKISEAVMEIESFKKTWGAAFKQTESVTEDYTGQMVATADEILVLTQKQDQITREESEIRRKIESLLRVDVAPETRTLEVERDIFAKKKELADVTHILEKISIEGRQVEERRERFREELREAQTLLGQYTVQYKKDSYSQEEILAESQRDREDRKRNLERLKLRLEGMGVTPGSQADLMQEYRELSDRDVHFETQLADLEKTKKSLEGLTDELDNKLNGAFKEGIEKINEIFGQYFGAMFGGGEAALALTEEKIENEDGEMEIKEGIDIKVNLPRKSIKSLMMLSGGERALTSIALLFAMSAINPPPFIILDETDAALDEANSKKYGDMIKDLAKQSQLVLITHNRETMSRAGVLYGVTMGMTGMSQVLSIKFDEAVKVAK